MGISADNQAIECLGLTKIYAGGATALHNLTLTIPAGESFALLGANGAGKSTLVRLLMGFLSPTAGILRIFGEERLLAAHRRVGYIHERPLFEARFTGREYLEYLGRLSGLQGQGNRARVESVLDQVELESAALKRVGVYSKGMLQRLAIAAALISGPDLLILDEPTSGLDPASQHDIRLILSALHAQGKTLLICSHYLDEVEALCTSVGILRRGRLVVHGTMAELTGGEDVVEIVLGGAEMAATVVARLDLSSHVLDVQQKTIRVRAASQQQALARLIDAGVALRSLNPVTSTLEDVYLRAAQPAEAEPERSSADAGHANESEG